MPQGGVTIYRHCILEGFKFDGFSQEEKVLTYQSYEFFFGAPIQVSLAFKTSNDMQVFRDAVSVLGLNFLICAFRSVPNSSYSLVLVV